MFKQRSEELRDPWLHGAWERHRPLKSKRTGVYKPWLYPRDSWPVLMSGQQFNKTRPELLFLR